MSASWTHRMARPLVRPMIGTPIRPNHLTTLRLLTGVAACACLGGEGRRRAWWGGGLWLASAFLDRADGELARLGDLRSRGGHLYDYYTDNAVNALFFAAIGFGQKRSWLGRWSVPLGLVSASSLLVCNVFSERLEQRSPAQARAYSGRWGFDPDDALYLMGPLAWLGWLSPILAAASVGTTSMMIITGLRLKRSIPRARP